MKIGTAETLASSNNGNNFTATQPQHSFPRAIFSVSREEFYSQSPNCEPLKLSVKRGLTEEVTILPEDLHGHVFVIAPVGSVSSTPVADSEAADRIVENSLWLNSSHSSGRTVLPFANGLTSLFNGDGMVYRLDFHKIPDCSAEELDRERIGTAWLACRIVKPPDYYLDEALSQQFLESTHLKCNDKDRKNFEVLSDAECELLRFRDWGLARFSVALGNRNQLNTALVAMSVPGQGERLLATWDPGRPYEIDPRSLETVAPVGMDSDWEPLIRIGPFQPLKSIMTSAHPAYDPNTGELFTVNITKTLVTLLKLPKLFANGSKKLGKLIRMPPEHWLVVAKFLKRWTPQLLQAVANDKGQDAVYLLRWDGQDSLQKWRVNFPKEDKLEQTIHQLGITDKFIVFADSSFKIAPEAFIPGWLEERFLKLLSNLRYFLTYPQAPNTNFYIVSRHDLNEQCDSVPVRKVTIPREIAHFELDYANPNGLITIHAANICASDPAEGILSYDESAYDSARKVRQDIKHPLAGMCCAPMDVGLIGCYVVDGYAGVLVKDAEASYVYDETRTWAIALPTYRRDVPDKGDRSTDPQLQDIYWISWGVWNDLLTADMYNMYDDYQYRKVPSRKIRDEIAARGIPCCLSRVHIERQTPEDLPKITLRSDCYIFPLGVFGSSPQFVPRLNSTNSTDGYIVCTVVHSNNLLSQTDDNKNENWSSNSEFWIFDAANLTQGPLYRLSHTKLNLGFTLHSTWLKELRSSPSRNYDIRSDYRSIFARIAQEQPERFPTIQKLFEEVVFPHYQ